MREMLVGLLMIAAPVSPLAAAQASADQGHSRAAAAMGNRLSFTGAARETALKQSYDERLAVQAREIDALLAERKRLKSQVAGERSRRGRAEAQLAVLERRIDALIADFNTRLAALNEEFAREREALTTVADDLLSTPDGRRALARLVEGDPGAQEEADAILARVQKARAAHRARQTIKANAADARVRAVFAKSGWEKGRVGVRTVIERYRDVVAIDPSDHWDWVQLGTLYLVFGALEQADEAARKALETAEDDRDRAVALGLLGDISVKRKDGPGALARHEESMDLRRGLLERDPSSVQAQRDLMLGLNDVGDMLLARNLTAQALERFEEGLKIARGLAEQEPDSIVAERDVFISLDHIGDTHMARNDRRNAVLHYEGALAIGEKLAAREPTSIEAKRDVALTLTEIGDALMRGGDAAGARSRFTDSLEIYRDLAKSDPNSARALRDLSVVLDRLGDLEAAEKNPDAALAHYEDGLDLARKLAAIDKSSGTAQLDLALSLSKVGDVLLARTNRAEALAYYEDSLRLIREIAARDPDSAEAQRHLLVALYKLADMQAPGHGWKTVKAQADFMRARKLNLPEDAEAFTEIDRHAAEEASKSHPR